MLLSRAAQAGNGTCVFPCDMAPIDILIVDPHPVTRAGIRQFLSVDPSLRIIGEASHTEKTQASDLVATIAVLGGCANTCHAELKAMKQAAPSLPVIVFSCVESDVRQFMLAGAAGVVCRTACGKQIREAIHTVAKGGMFFSPNKLEKLWCPVPPKSVPHKSLTQKEMEVFLKIVSGLPPRAIAAELQLSAKTISAHRANILQKMRMNSNADLVRYACSNQLIG